MVFENGPDKQRIFRWLLILMTVAVLIAVTYFSQITSTPANEHIELNKVHVRCDSSSDVSYGSNWKFSSNRSTAPMPCEICRKRFPGAIIAGIQKCGTGAILVFLNLHPEVKALVSRNEYTETEIKFFSMKYAKGLEWYRNQMPCSFSNQVIIEKDPPYFYRGFCPPRILKMDPATKIILIIKEPITRALSMHAMYVAAGQVKTTFEKELTDKSGNIKQNHIYLRFSSYDRYIDAWMENFDLKQIHFVDGHAFEDTPVTELRSLEHFLKIKPYFNESMFWTNETKGEKCFYTESKEPRCMGKGKGRAHEKIPEGLRKKLQTYFRPLNDKFFRKINRRFPWGY